MPLTPPPISRRPRAFPFAPYGQEEEEVLSPSLPPRQSDSSEEALRGPTLEAPPSLPMDPTPFRSRVLEASPEKRLKREMPDYSGGLTIPPNLPARDLQEKIANPPEAKGWRKVLGGILKYSGLPAYGEELQRPGYQKELGRLSTLAGLEDKRMETGRDIAKSEADISLRGAQTRSAEATEALRKKQEEQIGRPTLPKDFEELLTREAASEDPEVSKAARTLLTRIKTPASNYSGEAREFTDFYLPGYYAKLGKEPNPVDTQAAWQAFQESKQTLKPGQKSTLQEKLATLAAKPKRTPEEEAEKNAIEYAMTLVANQYGAGWKQASTPEGEMILQHPTQGRINLGSGVRPPYSATERMQVSSLDEMLGQVDMLGELANKNRDSIGFVSGKLAAVKRQVVGAGPEVNEMFRIADNLGDQLLRARSGAQINEQEYSRLRALTPNPRLSEEKFFSDLKGFRAELERTLARRSGAAPIVQNLPSKSTKKPAGATPGVIKWERGPDGLPRAVGAR